MKFDLIISNPPYNHGLDLKIMREIYELSDRFCFIHPAGWLYNKMDSRLYESIKEQYGNDFTDYEIIDVEEGNELFGIALYYDLVIDYYEKDNKVHDIRGIDVHGGSEIFNNIEEKISNYAAEISNMCDLSENYSHKKYDVGFHRFRGNPNTPDINTVLEIRNPKKHEFDNKESGHSHRFSFDTKQEQQNFLHYLRSKMFRFFLSLKKINQDIGNKHLEVIPYLPTYTHEWTDEMIAEEIGLTHEEMVWCINWIPDYYPGDEEKYEKYFDLEQPERQLINNKRKITYGGYSV